LALTTLAVCTSTLLADTPGGLPGVAGGLAGGMTGGGAGIGASILGSGDGGGDGDSCAAMNVELMAKAVSTVNDVFANFIVFLIAVDGFNKCGAELARHISDFC
jgi:hypothetical protein